MRAGEKSWLAHAWYLERVPPNLYALKNVNRSEAATDQPIGDQIDESQLMECCIFPSSISFSCWENCSEFHSTTRSLPALA